MKTLKIALLLAMLFVTAPAIMAQDNQEATATEKQVTYTEVTLEQMFKKVTAMKDADDMKISSFMISLARTFASKEDKEMLNKIKSMRIVTFKETNPEGKKEFEKYVSSVRLKDFITEEDGDTFSDDENSKIFPFVKIKGNTLTDIVVIEISDKESTLMHMNGKFTMDDMDELVNSNPLVEDAKNE